MYIGLDKSIPDCGTYSIQEDVGKYFLSKFKNQTGVSIGSRNLKDFADPYKPGPGTYKPNPEVVMPKTLVTTFSHARRRSIADVDGDKAKLPPPGAYTTICDFSCYGPFPYKNHQINSSLTL